MKSTVGFKHGVLTFKLFGHWELDTDKKWIKIVNKAYGQFCRVSLLFLVIMEVIYLRHVNDFESALEVLFILLLMASILFKQWNFSRNYKRIKVLYENLDFELFSSNTVEEDEYTRRAISITKRIYLALVGSGFLTFLGFIVFTLTDPKGPSLIILAEYPFDLHNMRNFAIAYFLQILTCTYSVAINLSIDTFCVGLIIHYISKLQCLLHQISEVGNDVLDNTENKNVLKITPTIQDTNEELFHQLGLVKYKVEKAYAENGPVYGRIYKCAMLHQIIFESCRELEDIFRTGFFLQILILGFILCSAAFQLQTIDLMSVKFSTIIGYILVVLCQLLLPCLAGNELNYNSTEIARKAFEGRIESLDFKSSKMLLMLMQRSRNPIEIKAGSTMKITLNLENYMSILKTCYSYFALMQTVGKNNK